MESGSFQYDPSLMQAYNETLRKLTAKGSSTAAEWQFLRRAVLALETARGLRSSAGSSRIVPRGLPICRACDGCCLPLHPCHA